MRRLELCFIDSPRVFGFLGYLQSKEVTREAAQVGTTHQGAPGGPGVPWWVVPTSLASRTTSLPYKNPNILKTLGEPMEHNASLHMF